MTEVAMTQEKSQPNRFAMLISFLMALPLAAVLLIHPSMMLDANGEYSHRAMMFIMIGISGGFIHGVGFVAKFWLWKYLFNPYVAWPLMIFGYYTWLFK
ncbi:cyd operon YbgE family protein [Acinetobacter lanii]|uniref:Cytochrome bd biosynthesis protein n=1 Tax=Acinetobacter lanii TaxID=2715163 RepID=A0A6G8S4H9_9GAMM|nr:cyd operon YbgE family protein [Acinetobacter lanii]QIO09109.1 cytochrome bd biosynthesis protein [Acinetobacter lanii]